MCCVTFLDDTTDFAFEIDAKTVSRIWQCICHCQSRLEHPNPELNKTNVDFGQSVSGCGCSDLLCPGPKSSAFL